MKDWVKFMQFNCLREGSKLSVESLNEFLSDKLAAFKIPVK